MTKRRIKDGEYYILYKNIEFINSESGLEMVLVLVVNEEPDLITVSAKVGSTKLLRIPFSGRELYEIGEIIKVSDNGKIVDKL